MTTKLIVLKACPDCGAQPGQPHREGCDTERCSVCGGQRYRCACRGHDGAFARWTGLWPGDAEAQALGIDLNTFTRLGLNKTFHVKPDPWIRCTDDLPTHRETVQIANLQWPAEKVWSGRYLGPLGWISAEGMTLTAPPDSCEGNAEPTHWMHLPEPPSEQNR